MVAILTKKECLNPSAHHNKLSVFHEALTSAGLVASENVGDLIDPIRLLRA